MNNSFNEFKTDIKKAIEKLVEGEKGDRKIITAALNAGMTYIQYNLLENGMDCYYIYDETNFGKSKAIEKGDNID